jgi:hypothetical protein
LGYAGIHPDPEQVACPPWTRRDIGDMYVLREKLAWLLSEIKSGCSITEERHGWTIRNIIALCKTLDEKESDFQARANFSPTQPRVPRGTIEPVYPVETLIATVYGGRAFSLAVSVIRRPPAQESLYNRERQTDHGHQRIGDRSITDKDIDTAIETAKKTGNITVKKGPYNTPQYHYHGSNGLTVIVETRCRNAGKIITMYGKKPGGKL